MGFVRKALPQPFHMKGKRKNENLDKVDPDLQYHLRCSASGSAGLPAAALLDYARLYLRR
jgi:hypothetical protein